MVSTPEAFVRYGPVLAAAGIVGIVYGAALALGQSDLKRLIACSSIAHMGFVVLALSTGTASGLAAALLGMVSHGLVSGLLFLLAGALNDRAHTRRIDAFGGLGASMPAWGTAFVVASLASAGLPGLSGFPGEFWSLVAAFTKWGWWAAVAVLGTVVAAAYALDPVRRIVGGEPSAERSYRDLGSHELAATVPLVALIVVLGVWPRAVTDLAGVTVRAITAALEVVGR
jgi:NADH-quinone oxidoreductase subunit M